MGSGGAQRQLVELAKAFRLEGYDVRFLTYHKHDFYSQVLTQYEIPNTCLDGHRYLRRFIRMRSFIRKGSFDVVLSFLEGSNAICEMSGFPFRKWKLIVGERSANPSITKSFRLILFRWLHLFSDFIVSNSDANIEIVRKASPFIPKRKCKVIYNMVDNELFQLEESRNITLNKKRHLIIGASHRYVKNGIGLVQAISNLPVSIKRNLQVSWYGDKIEPPYFDDSFVEVVKAVRKFNLEKIITFYPATSEFIEIIKEADAVGLFSYYEGLPNTICEGMSLGKPVIVSNVSDMPTLLGHDLRQTCDPNNIESITQVIEFFVNTDAKTLEDLGSKNKEVAQKYFSKKKIVNQYLNLMKG